MYLKSIKAYGFKSFADKTAIDFKNGITVFVGPNGSGKSNIVDAVRWVLGEQSVKALRGTSGMVDVIFSGSKSRSPHNYATVTLVFDNTDHYLNSEYSEIEVKRVCYQTGENEYYLNNNQVRLKDITDLFIDSGASKEAFNIISQGKVSDIINQKPEERRTMIEEAAGVLKYKKRKEETLRKLERTNENLERINLIIKELEVNLEPLKIQAEVAKKHLSFKKDLESIEIALIAQDIHTLNSEYETLKIEVSGLQENIIKEETNTRQSEQKVETLKLKILKLEDKINGFNQDLLSATENIASLEAKKQTMKERKKYDADDSKLQGNVISLKENELNIKKSINLIKKEIDDLKTGILNKTAKQEELSFEIKKTTLTRNNLDNELNEANKREMVLKNQRDIIESNINNDAKMPYAVKNVLNNPRLTGIHDVLGRVIETDSNYSTAIEVALGFNSNVVIVDDDVSTKGAINFLKENALGRVTFFPLNVIKPRGIDEETIDKISSLPGFVGIASDLVRYDAIYRNIVLNQLGNTIIVKDIDQMNELGRKINYRYRIITLDGELLHTGGSVTGGSSKSTKGLVSERYELERIIKDLNNNTLNVKKINQELTSINQELNILNNNYLQITNQITSLEEIINQKNIYLETQNNNYDNISLELKGTNAILNNEVDQELDKILEDYNQAVSKKELIESNLTNAKNEKDDLTYELGLIELNRKKELTSFNTYQNELRDKEIKSNRIEIKLDNLLNTLNEDYSLTYEKAYETYELDLDIETARLKVQTLKSDIKSLGDVNTGSISEFERIDKRYSFLTKQKDDLVGGINNLNEIIISLDETMKERFKDTFDKVNKEFEIVFKELFKGGKGFLTLTNPDDILETGVEINAEPPGKTLRLISLLSGGEMTLTAIALLFSILNIRPVPFCILDEVEANLDDVNVDTFGKYIRHYENKTQFIIITHKKRTMEYADSLYGITMQESGVSKIVSVKLDNLG